MSLRAHNILDYIAALALILSPFVFGFYEVDRARNLFLTMGFVLIAYSMMSNYYYSLAKIIPLGVHMVLDLAIGVVIVFAPYVFRYREDLAPGQVVLNFIMGLVPIALAIFSRTRTEKDKTPREHELTDRGLHGST